VQNGHQRFLLHMSGRAMHFHSTRHERGMALVSALLLLLVVTILGVGMFRSFGLQERIAGNTRERERATHAAETAQTYAEWWLSSNNGANASPGVDCSTLTSLAVPTICTNVLTNVSTTPWTISAAYQPPNMTIAAAGTIGAYVSAPQYYISFLAGHYDPTGGTQTNAYQIDGMSYGGNTSSVAVVESTYLVSVTYTARDSDTKFGKLDGP
jgi:type IV pilus assembly protein PilX